MMRLPGFLGNPSVTSQPPTRADLRRNDWILFVAVVLLMTAGWVLVRLSSTPQRLQTVGAGIPEIAYPAGWLLAGAEGERLFGAYNPETSGLFGSSMEIVALEAQPGTALDEVRAGLSLQRSRELERYRELTAERVMALGAPALLVTYAYVADPTQDSGGNGLPVVVEAQDLIFANGEAWARATTVADSAEFAREQPAFERLFASLGLKRRAQ